MCSGLAKLYFKTIFENATESRRKILQHTGNVHAIYAYNIHNMQHGRENSVFLNHKDFPMNFQPLGFFTSDSAFSCVCYYGVCPFVLKK